MLAPTPTIDDQMTTISSVSKTALQMVYISPAHNGINLL